MDLSAQDKNLQKNYCVRSRTTKARALTHTPDISFRFGELSRTTPQLPSNIEQVLKNLAQHEADGRSGSMTRARKQVEITTFSLFT